MNEPSNVIRDAEQAEISRSWFSTIKLWFAERKVSELFTMVIALGILIVATVWEATNAAAGYVLLAQNVAPAWIAWIFGFCAPFGYFVFHRRASEFYRANDYMQMSRSILVAFALTFLALIGVFSNVASKTGLQAENAKEINEARRALIVEKMTLEAEVQPETVALTESFITVTERQIRSKEAEATGWRMPDTDPTGYCAQDLRPRQRQICNDLNGTGSDNMGLRNELEMHKTTIEVANIKRDRIEEIETELGGLKLTEGAAHWGSMSRLTNGNVGSDWFQIWGSFAISVLVLIVVGFGWDSFLEGRQRELERLDDNAHG